MMYYTYMLRCSDNSIYTGITTDTDRRFEEHMSSRKLGAKYTKSRTPVKIELVFSSPGRSEASKLEYAIKQLSKVQKEQLIKDPSKLYVIIGNKLDCKVYKHVV